MEISEYLHLLLAPALSFAAAIIATFVGFITVRKKIRTELIAEFKKELRTERLRAYKAIWKMLYPVALYSPSRDLSRDALAKMAGELSISYFDHGMFLSKECRDYYFVLQDGIQLILRTNDDENYVLRAQATRLTMSELKQKEEQLGLKYDQTPSTEQLRENVLPRIGKDPENDYQFIRYLSSQLRTKLSDDIESRDEIWAGLAQGSN